MKILSMHFKFLKLRGLNLYRSDTAD